jgi:hypothetical protein
MFYSSFFDIMSEANCYKNGVSTRLFQTSLLNRSFRVATNWLGLYSNPSPLRWRFIMAKQDGITKREKMMSFVGLEKETTKQFLPRYGSTI